MSGGGGPTRTRRWVALVAAGALAILCALARPCGSETPQPPTSPRQAAHRAAAGFEDERVDRTTGTERASPKPAAAEADPARSADAAESDEPRVAVALPPIPLKELGVVRCRLGHAAERLDLGSPTIAKNGCPVYFMAVGDDLTAYSGIQESESDFLADPAFRPVQVGFGAEVLGLGPAGLRPQASTPLADTWRLITAVDGVSVVGLDSWEQAQVAHDLLVALENGDAPPVAGVEPQLVP